MNQVLSSVLLLSFFFLSFSSAAEVQPQPAIMAPLVKQSLLLDIVKTESGKLIAVGERGHIITSDDGIEWLQSAVPVQSTLVAVDFVNDNVGWAVGHDSTILKSVDGGKTWAIQYFDPALEKPFLDVLFFDEQEGIAIGAYGLFLRTMDSGQTWQQEFHLSLLQEEDVEYLAEVKAEDEALYQEELSAILPHFNRLKLLNSELYMVGEVGLIAKSNNKGRDWELLDEIYSGSFFDVQAVDETTMFIAGLRGHLFKSDDTGETWSEVDTDITGSINSIYIAPNGTIYLLANNGNLLISKDKGLSFQNNLQSHGKALIAGVSKGDMLIMVTEDGIKTVREK